MQRSYVARRSPASAFAIMLVVLGALILGGLGGYLLKGVDHLIASTPSAVTRLTVPVDRTNGGPTAQSTRWLKQHD